MKFRRVILAIGAYELSLLIARTHAFQALLTEAYCVAEEYIDRRRA